MLALWIRDRLLKNAERSGTSTVVDVFFVYGSILLSQELIGILNPALALSWAPTQGGYVGVMLFAATRALFAGPTNSIDDNPGLDSIEDLADKGRRYRKAYRIGALAALFVGLVAAFAGGRRARLAAALVIAGSDYLLWQVLIDKRLKDPHPQPRLEGMIETLRRATLWCYIALLPASVLALFGSVIYLYWFPIVILMFAEANQRAAASLNIALHSVQTGVFGNIPASLARNRASMLT